MVSTPTDLTGSVVCILLVIISVLPIILSIKHKNITFLIIYLYLFFYSIVPIQYYFGNNDIVRWGTQCQTPNTVYQTSLSIIVFYIFIIWGQWGTNTRSYQQDQEIWVNNNTYGFICCVALSVICIVFGKSGDTILSAGSYVDSLKNSNLSTLYGYGVIPLLIGIQFASSAKKKNIILAISAIYVIKDFLFGGRIDSIQLCIGLYVLYFRYKWSIKQTIIVAILAFSIVSAWGIFRNSVQDGFVEAIYNYIDHIGEDGNNSEVYYSSMRIFYFIDKGILSFQLRIEALINFILSIFIPYSELPPIANLSSWYKDYAPCGGGGLVSVFMVAMVGWAGLAVFAYFLGHQFRKYQLGKGSQFFKFWVVMTILSTPRWYAYYPIAIFKFALYGAILFYLLNRVFRPSLR